MFQMSPFPGVCILLALVISAHMQYIEDHNYNTGNHLQLVGGAERVAVRCGAVR